MKTSMLAFIGLLSLALAGCATRTDGLRMGAEPGVTTVALSGDPGALIIGNYRQHSRRVGFTNAVPFALSMGGNFEVELRKTDLQTTIMIHAWRQGIEVSGTAGPGVPGFHVASTNGLELHGLSR